MAKQYAAPDTYEAKLEKVMARLGVDGYNYDWSRFDCWVSFVYKGQHYKFSHSLENAKAHGVNVKYGSDLFAQVVLSLEDLARMVERGIYDLSTWVAGMQYIEAPKEIEFCFRSLNFTETPSLPDLNKRYKELAKVYHPDDGGTEMEFMALQKNYEECLALMEQEELKWMQ